MSDDKADRLRRIFSSPARFGKEELQILREDCSYIQMLVTGGSWVETRLTAELIDCIRHLDQTSTRLIETTNKLTAVNLGVAIVVGVATVLGVGIAAIQIFQRL
jgi:hypothetical protein